MNIALVSTLYHGGGAERSARELFLGLRRQGHRARMFVAHLKGQEPDGVVAVRYPLEKWLRVFELLGMEADWRHVGSMLALARIGAGEFDLVHLHNLHGGWMSIGAVKRLCGRVPCVWTLHDEWAPSGGLPYDLGRVLDDQAPASWYPPGWQAYRGDDPSARRRRGRLLRRMPRPAAVVCPSTYLCQMAREAPALAGVAVKHLAYGVTMLGRKESRLEQGECRAALGIGRNERVILLIAADFLSPYKGMGLGVEVLEHVAKLARGSLENGAGGGGVTVLLLGSNTSALRVPPPLRTVDAGFVGDEGLLARAYRAADVTLVPSIADNLPYVALESLSCETPVAAFEVGGLVDLVGTSEQRGVLAPRFDAAELARKLWRLLECEPDRRAKGASGGRWVAENCEMNRWIDSHVELYQRVAFPEGARSGASMDDNSLIRASGAARECGTTEPRA